MRVGAFDKGEADGNLGTETDDCGCDLGIHERGNGNVDVAWVRGEK